MQSVPDLLLHRGEAVCAALLLCLLSTLALLKAVRSGSRWWWAAYALWACAAAYTQFTGVFVLVAQFAWAFLAYPRAHGS